MRLARYLHVIANAAQARTGCRKQSDHFDYPQRNYVERGRVLRIPEQQGCQRDLFPITKLLTW